MKPEKEELPSSELGKLEGACGLTYTLLTCDIYNGSNWLVSEIMILITLKERDKKKKTDLTVSSRRYQMTRYSGSDLEPANYAPFQIYLGFGLAKGQHFEWNFVSAWGRPASAR